MINKYGNDFKNNIMWNKEYPFIPEVTNDDGFTIHEGDIVDYYDPHDKCYYATRVYKIYNKDVVWTRFFQPGLGLTTFVLEANRLLPHDESLVPPVLEDYDNQGFFNCLENFLASAYLIVYGNELDLEDDWHFDEEKYERKRLEEVAKLKQKY